ncbi:MAG TPA: type II toxin-antitoxin system HicB family antitoxin [Geminicoccaceae bacterium]|nr:type II toxin-antitoxin system HicB family antitoxin [Geminicoccus sp.]HMU52857.1 type II toxin-antitoxin system HicB family antitoxin [Geminicoccaceae bacterium]
MATYVALLSKDADSDYGVHFPDFPGCVTAGSNLDEVRAMVQEALSFHIEGLAEDGRRLPAATPLAGVMADPENAGSFPFLVRVDRKSGAAEVDASLNDAFTQARLAAAQAA